MFNRSKKYNESKIRLSKICKRLNGVDMNVEIDLMEGLKDPEKAKTVVKQVQKAIDDLTKGFQQAMVAAESAQKVADDYSGQVSILVRSNAELQGAIKDIHLLLNAKKDLWENDTEMQSLVTELGKHVMSSSAIKAGVIDEAQNQTL